MMKMIKTFLAAFLACTVAGARAQFDTLFIKNNILRCADSLAIGFRTRDWELFTRYSYPALVGTLGGKQSFISYVSNTFARIPVTAWKKYEPGKVLQVIKTEGDFQAVIELKSVIEFEGKRVSSTGYLIGESWDGGMFFTFFDSQNDRVLAKTIKPDLSNALVIPAKKEKVEPLN
jgi:hypothetical protein